MKVKTIFVAFVCIGFLVNCGGGGGGGGGSSSSHGVRVLHASIDDAPLSIVSSTKPEELMQTTRFADNSSYVSVGKGTQNISVEGGQVGKLYSSNFSISDKESYSILFYRHAHTDEARLAVMSDEKPDFDSDQSAIRVVHAVKGAAALLGELNGSSQRVSYAEGGAYLIVPSGLQQISVRREVDGKLLSTRSLNLEAGKAYTLLMSGEVDYLVVSTLLDG